MQPAPKKNIVLDQGIRSGRVLEFERLLRHSVVGQDEAVSQLVNMYQIFIAGMNSPGRPLANLLFLGPTGSGKTHIVEVLAEITSGHRQGLMKIDCAEFQHSHEISKLIGSPPGYLGHRETPPGITQEKLTRFYTDRYRLSIVLFDEIEKANDALWQLLLGILDKATLTLGDNRKVDFSRTIVFMTSNLGAVEMSELITGGIGFVSGREKSETLDKNMRRVALDAAKRKFSPEFMNRIDKVVVFRSLNEKQLEAVLDLELAAVQERILSTQPDRPFSLQYTKEARAFLLREGISRKYGARHLKRAIEKHLVYPISSLISTDQISRGNRVQADLSSSEDSLTFSKDDSFIDQRVVETSSLTPTEEARAPRLIFSDMNDDLQKTDDRHSFNGLRRGDLIALSSLAIQNYPPKITNAKQLQIVGFTEDDEIVIQINGMVCFMETLDVFKKHYLVLAR